MGIHNIQVLIEPPHASHTARKLQEYIEAKRLVEHRGGKHPIGFRRRDCPLCDAGK